MKLLHPKIFTPFGPHHPVELFPSAKKENFLLMASSIFPSVSSVGLDLTTAVVAAVETSGEITFYHCDFKR